MAPGLWHTALDGRRIRLQGCWATGSGCGVLAMIDERDEWLHEVGADPAWQESFYFNWADPGRRSFTLARTGYRFHARKTDGLAISLRDGANHALRHARIDYEWGEQEHQMRGAEIELVEAGGCTHRLHAEALGGFPILRGDVWLEETHVAYTLEGTGPAGSRQGQGVVEHVWRATPEEIGARRTRLAAILKALRR